MLTPQSVAHTDSPGSGAARCGGHSPTAAAAPTGSSTTSAATVARGRRPGPMARVLHRRGPGSRGPSNNGRRGIATSAESRPRTRCPPPCRRPRGRAVRAPARGAGRRACTPAMCRAARSRATTRQPGHGHDDDHEGREQHRHQPGEDREADAPPGAGRVVAAPWPCRRSWFAGPRCRPRPGRP